MPAQSSSPSASVVTTLMRREIDRFVEAARVRSEFDTDTRRRAMRRYHRSWPLLITGVLGVDEVSAALHNASSDGIGFLCDHKYSGGDIVLIKLFWHEDAAIRVPAVVRHASHYRDVVLVGCQFAIDDTEACQAGMRTHSWFDR